MKFLGECLSILSASLEAYERGCKTYKKSIIVGLIRYSIQAVSYIFLGGINGVIITFMAIVRSILMYHKKFSGIVIGIWISFSVAINLYFASAIADIFPLIATLQFTFMAKKQNALWLKIAQIINALIWSVYHVYHKTYIYLLFDVILTIIGIVRILKGVED